MPAGSRTRANAPQEVVAEVEDQEMDDGLPTLQFDETLSWRAGKPIPVKELLNRLETLSVELRTVGQEDFNKNSLKTVAKELVNANLLSHKDRGVRAWAGCCLVDVLRISAPDAPYTAKDLKEIFNLCILSIIPSLAEPSHPYNSQHLYVLKSLADFKSIILLTDIPASSSLVHQLFVTCFDVLSGPSKSDSGEQLSKNVEHHMTSILATLVDEAQALPPDVIDTILAQFLRADPRFATNGVSKGKKAAPVDERQSTLLLKEAPPAYNMAKNICNSCPEKMARYVTRYFGAVISEIPTAISENDGLKRKPQKRKAAHADDSDEDLDDADFEENWKEIAKTHSLMRELWRSTPAVLQEIIPSMESELQAQNVRLRLLAVETVGDMISGIGKGGLPPAQTMNPAAWPSQSVEPPERAQVYNFLTTPTSPVSFISRYSQVYSAFLRRKDDSIPQIRSAWATAAGRIISTSAGGVGLDADTEKTLLKHFADCFRDVDEKVRYQAVKAIDQLEFSTIVQTVGGIGGVNDANSVLANLAELATDRKPLVHTEVIQLLARLWGVAAGAIAEGSERITSMLGPIPSRIFDAYYKNLPEITALVDRALYESLLPLTYPPIKPKAPSKSQSQRIKDSQSGDAEQDPDRLRTERILVLVRGLDVRSKTVFFSRIANQSVHAKYMIAYLDLCEQYNGGVIASGEKEVKARLSQFIEHFLKYLSEPSKAREDLWKFAKAHDRRNYQLIRFCTDPTSDYRKVQKAIKELTKRLEEASGTGTSLITNLHTLVYRSSILVYNRSHVPVFIEYSRTDNKGLASTAHEILGEISKYKSEVFKTHIQELCRSLEAEAPTSKRHDAPGAVYDLKACAQYVSKFPDDIPKDRKFLQALLGFVSYGTVPKAAKHAVEIILLAGERQQMYAKDIYKICAGDFEYGKGNFLVKLAGLSQLMLLGHKWIAGPSADKVVEIAISKVLNNKQAAPQAVESDADVEWTDEPDEHCQAKIWAMKILVNSIRARDEDTADNNAAAAAFTFLESTVSKRGRLLGEQGPRAHAARVCLHASTLLLKLCRESRYNTLLTPAAFSELALVIQDPCLPVREGYAKKLMKYLGQKKLTNRFYTHLFLLAHEPNKVFKESAMTWLRSRAAAFARAKEIAMELIFARLLSVLSHHPDFSIPEDDENYTDSLKDFARYILFFLLTVATPDNLGLIYHIAQRVKSVQDGIGPEPQDGSPDYSEHLYILSDLSQGVIRAFQDAKGWSLPSWPTKVGMPSGIFKAMPNHETAQKIAMKRFLPDELAEDGLDDVVKKELRTTKKRRSDSTGEHGTASKKRVKSAGSAPSASRAKKETKLDIKREIKTPKRRKKSRDHDTSETAIPSSDRRRSSRHSAQKNYMESSDEEDEAMADADGADQEDSQDSDTEAETGAQRADSPADSEPSESPTEKPLPEKKPSSASKLLAVRRGAAPLKTNGVVKGVVKKEPRSQTAAKPTKSTRNGTKGKAEVFDISSDKSSSLSELSDEE